LDDFAPPIWKRYYLLSNLCEKLCYKDEENKITKGLALLDILEYIMHVTELSPSDSIDHLNWCNVILKYMDDWSGEVDEWYFCNKESWQPVNTSIFKDYGTLSDYYKTIFLLVTVLKFLKENLIDDAIPVLRKLVIVPKLDPVCRAISYMCLIKLYPESKIDCDYVLKLIGQEVDKKENLIFSDLEFPINMWSMVLDYQKRQVQKNTDNKIQYDLPLINIGFKLLKTHVTLIKNFIGGNQNIAKKVSDVSYSLNEFVNNLRDHFKEYESNNKQIDPPKTFEDQALYIISNAEKLLTWWEKKLILL